MKTRPPRDLPPLNALRFLEAAVRVESFKLAAEELHVTPSAVSHGIQAMERWFGQPLFIREGRALKPTVDAVRYAARVRDALGQLHDATDRVPGRKAQGHLTISAAPTFASRWLLPRLRSFTDKFPDIRVTLDSSRHRIETELTGVDLAIRRADAVSGPQTWLRLVREEIVPVCSPDFLARGGKADARTVLAGGPHIRVTPVNESWNDWIPESAETGAAAPIEVDTIALAIEAAIAGLGIALAHTPLINDDIDSGRLLPLAKGKPAQACYWLVGSDRIFERPEARLFRHWLVSELNAGE